jgi:hypothetical protein
MNSGYCAESPVHPLSGAPADLNFFNYFVKAKAVEPPQNG